MAQDRRGNNLSQEDRKKGGRNSHKGGRQSDQESNRGQ